MVGGEEQKMFTIRQEARPSMSRMSIAIEFSETFGRSSGGADFPNRIPVVGFIDDEIVLIPCAPTRIWSLRKNGDGSTRGGDFLKMTIRKKPYKLSIG